MNLLSPFPPSVQPATVAQQQIHALEARHPGRPVANFPVALQFDGPVDSAALARSLNAVVARHEIFRVRFDRVRGQLVQCVAPTLTVPVPIIDLRLLPPEARAPQAFRLAREEAGRLFDGQRLPLLRAQLYIVEETRSIFVLTLHRGIFDPGSRGILLHELAAGYAPAGGEAPLEPSVVPSVPSLERPAPTARAAAWWQSRLDHSPAPFHLPSDGPHPTISTGRIEHLPLDAAQRDALESFASREGTSAFIVLLTVFQVLLHRYTGDVDFIFGLGLTDRSAGEKLAGPFSQVVPFRAALAADPVVRRLLTRVRTDLLDTFIHPYVPAAIPGGTDPALACPVWFSVDEAPRHGPGEWTGLTAQELDLDAGTCPAELCFQVEEKYGGLCLHASYDATLFSPAFIQRLLGHYGVLLDATVTRPHARVSTLPLLTVSEQRRLFGEWNHPPGDSPRDATVPELIAAHSRTQPDRLATTGLTYEKWEKRSNQLGRHLRAAGVRPGSCVALCVTQPADLLVGVAGVMKAGGMVLPLDPADPDAYHARWLEESRAQWVLTETPQRTRLPAATKMILLDVEADDLRRADDAQLVALAGPADPAWVCVTRGTTGTPRLVSFSHRSLVSKLHALQRVFAIKPDDTLLATAPLSSSAAICDLLLPLVFGACVDWPATATLADPAPLATYIAASGATVMAATPTVWLNLLETGWTGAPGLRLFSRDEPLTRALADRLLPCGAQLVNLYGTTETTGPCLAAVITPGTTTPAAGRPLAETQVHLLDAQLQPLPVGLSGEIHVGGDALALGYLNAPATQTSLFIRDPFRHLAAARLFCTGDRGRRLPNGEIEWLARLTPPVIAAPLPVPRRETVPPEEPVPFAPLTSASPFATATVPLSTC